MLRVVYRWRLQPENADKFRAAWEKATTSIRSSTPGARGSVLLQNRQDPAEVMTIARWDRFEDWQTFWKGAPQDDMEFMQNLAELLSSQVFDELGDHTI